MIANLTTCDQTVKIQFTSGNGAITIYNDIKGAIGGKGSGSTILFNPNFTPQGLTPNPIINKNVFTSVSSNIVFGHELIHADIASRGKMKSKTIKSDNIFELYDGNMYIQKVEDNELETVGLFSNSDYVCTENYLREENGTGPRVAY